MRQILVPCTVLALLGAGLTGGAQAPSPVDHLTDAREALHQAFILADKLDPAFVRSRTIQIVAIARARSGDYAGAVKTAARASEAQDRARALGYISALQRKSAAAAEADATLDLARAAVESATGDEKYMASMAAAQGLAHGGDDSTARKWSEAAPDARMRAEGLYALADEQRNRGRADFAAVTLKEALAAAEQIKEAKDRDRLIAYLAETMAHCRDLETALKTAALVKDPDAKPRALHATAEAQAFGGKFDEALKTARSIRDAPTRVAAMETIASAQMEQGDKEAAFHTVDGIGSGFSVVRAMLEISRVQATQNSDKASGASLEIALAYARGLEEAERNQALGLVAVAQAMKGEFAESRATLDEIEGAIARIEPVRRLAWQRTRAGESKAVREWIAGLKAPEERAWGLIGVASGLLDLVETERK